MQRYKNLAVTQTLPAMNTVLTSSGYNSKTVRFIVTLIQVPVRKILNE